MSQADLKKASLKELLLTMTKWALQASDKISQAPVWIPETTTPAPTTTTTTTPTTQTTIVTTPNVPKKPKEPSFSMLASPDVLHKYFRHDRLPLVMNKFTPPPTAPRTTRRLTTGARTTRIILLNVHKPALSQQTVQAPSSSQHYQGSRNAQGLGHNQHDGRHHMKHPESRQGLSYEHHQARSHMSQPDRMPYQHGQAIPQDQRRMQPVDGPKDKFTNRREHNSPNGYQNMHSSGNYQHPKDPNIPQKGIPASHHNVPNHYDVNSNDPYNHHPERHQGHVLPYEGPHNAANGGGNKPTKPNHQYTVNNGPHVDSHQHRYSNNQAQSVSYEIHHSGPHLETVNSNRPVAGNSGHQDAHINNTSSNSPLDSQKGAHSPQSSDPNQNMQHINGSNVHDTIHKALNVPYTPKESSQPNAAKQNSVNGKDALNYIDIPLDGKMDIQSLLKKLLAMNNPPATADQTNIEFATGSKIYQHPSSNELPKNQPVNASVAVNIQQKIHSDIKINAAQESSLAQLKNEQPQINPRPNSIDSKPVNDTIIKPPNVATINPTRPPAHVEHHLRPNYNPYYHSQKQYDATVNAQGVPPGGQAVSTGSEYHASKQGQYQYQNIPDLRTPETSGRVDLHHIQDVNNTSERIHHPNRTPTNSSSGASSNERPTAAISELYPNQSRQNPQEPNTKTAKPGSPEHGQYPYNHQDSIPRQGSHVGSIDSHPSGKVPPQLSELGTVNNYPNSHENTPRRHGQSDGQPKQQNSIRPWSNVKPSVDHHSRDHGTHFDSRGRPIYDPNDPHPRADGYPKWPRPHRQELPPNMQLKSGFYSYPHESYPKPSGPSQHEPYPQTSRVGGNHRDGKYPQPNSLSPHESYKKLPGAAAKLQEGALSHPNALNPHEPYSKPSGAAAKHQEGALSHPNVLNPHEPYPGAAAKHQEGALSHPNALNPHEPYPGATAKHQEGALFHPNSLNSKEPYLRAAAKHQQRTLSHPNALNPHEPYPGATAKHQEGVHPQPNGLNPKESYPGAAAKHNEGVHTHSKSLHESYPKPPGAASKHQESAHPQPNDLSPHKPYPEVAPKHQKEAFLHNGISQQEPYPNPGGFVPHDAPPEPYLGHHHGPRRQPAHYNSDHQYYPRAHQNRAFPQAEYGSHHNSGSHYGPEYYPPISPNKPESEPRYNPHDVIFSRHPETTTNVESTTTPTPFVSTTVRPIPTNAPKSNGPSSLADINKRIAELMKQIQKLNKAPDATAPLDSVSSIALHPASPLLQRTPAQSTNPQNNGQAEQPNFEEIIRDINNHRQENGLGTGDVNKVGEHIIMEEGLNPSGEHQPVNNLSKDLPGLDKTHDVLNGMVQRHPGDLLNTTPQPTQPNFATVHSQPDPHVVVWNGALNEAIPNPKTLKAIRQHLISQSKSLWDMNQKTNAEILKKTEVLNHDSTILTRPYTVVEQGKIKNINSVILNDYIVKLMNNQTKSGSKIASENKHAQNTKGVPGAHAPAEKKVLIKIPKLSNPSASSLIHKIMEQGHLNVDTSSAVSNASDAAPYQIHVPKPLPDTPIQNVFQIVIPGSEIDVSTQPPSEIFTTTEEPPQPTTTTPEVTTPIDPEAAEEEAMKNSNAEFYNYYYYEDD